MWRVQWNGSRGATATCEAAKDSVKVKDILPYSGESVNHLRPLILHEGYGNFNWLISSYEVVSIQPGVNVTWLTRVAKVLRRARHDGGHALTTERWRVNITWTGAPTLLNVQAVVVLKDSWERSEVEEECKITTVHLITLVWSGLLVTPGRGRPTWE